MSDRRQSPRTTLPPGAVVRVRFKNKKQFRKMWVKDISRNGIFLRTDTPLEPFERVTVVLELPDGQSVELHGDVVRTIRPEQAGEGAVAGMGVQLVDLTPDKRAVLESYLARARTLPPGAPPPPPTVKPVARPAPTLPDGPEALIHALRRVIWACADATRLPLWDYYELLGVAPGAGADEIRAACDVLRALLDPATPPPGVNRDESARLSALLMVLSDVEATLTDPARRRAYDAGRQGRS